MVGVYKALRSSVPEVVRFSVHDVTRLHTVSLHGCYRIRLLNIHDHLGRLRTRALAPGDTVADQPAVNALGDVSRALDADDMRLLHRMHTRTTARVAEIHARNLDELHARPRLRNLDLAELEGQRPTILHSTNCPEEDAARV